MEFFPEALALNPTYFQGEVDAACLWVCLKIPHFLLAGFPPRTTDPKKPGIYLGAKGVQGPLVPTEGPPVLSLPLHCRVGVIFSLFKKSCELHSESGHVQTMKKGISTAHALHTADSSPLQAATQE